MDTEEAADMYVVDMPAVVPLPPIDSNAPGPAAAATDVDEVDAPLIDDLCHLMETLPLELLLNVLAQTDTQSLGRLGCSSRICAAVCSRGQLVWARMLAQELRCGVPPGALRDLPAQEALRRWTTRSDWKWCEQRLNTCGVDDLGEPAEAPKRFLQRAACVEPPPRAPDAYMSPRRSVPPGSPRSPGGGSSTLLDDDSDCGSGLPSGAGSYPAPKACLLFGGSSHDPRAHHSTYYNDTWQVELGTMTLRRVEQRAWLPQAPAGLLRSMSAPETRGETALAAAATRHWGQPREELPAPRTAFSLTALGNKLFLFGGHTLAHGFINDLWEAEVHFSDDNYGCAGDYTTGGGGGDPIVELLEWRRLGPFPSMHGGADADGADADAPGDDGQGADPAAAGGGGAGQNPPRWPTHRQGHSATVMDCGIVLFGGSYPAMALNDTWLLQPDTTTATDSDADDDAHQLFVRAQPDGPLPLPRAGHAAVTVDRRHLLIFGGNTSESTLAPDLWCLDTCAGLDNLPGSGYSWSEVSVTGMRPSARIGHSAVVLGQTVLIYGGRNLFEEPEEHNSGGALARCKHHSLPQSSFWRRFLCILFARFRRVVSLG